jgi:hypothetical protein
MVGGVGHFEPSIPQIGTPPNQTNDPAYAIAAFGDVPLPDGRTKRVTGVVTNGIHQLRDATAQEIADIDAAQPLWIDGREVMRRLAASTHLGLERLSQTDATVCKLWNTLKAGGNVNVHSAEFIEGAAYLGTVGIPSVWPDVAAFDAELASEQRQ